MKFFLFCLLFTANVSLAFSATEFFVPHVVSGIEPEQASPRFAMETFFEIVNLTESEVEVEITAFSNQGQPLEVFFGGPTIEPMPVSAESRQLRPLGTATAATGLTTGGHWPLKTGWAKVSSSGPIGLVVRYGAEEAVQCETALPCFQRVISTSLLPEPRLSQFSTIVFLSDQVGTGIALLNFSEEEIAEITLQLRNGLGELVSEKTVVLAPKNRIVQFLNEKGLFADVAVQEGSIDVASSSPIVVTVVRVEGFYWSAFRTFPQRPVQSEEP